jgi:hypothetical protein
MHYPHRVEQNQAGRNRDAHDAEGTKKARVEREGQAQENALAKIHGHAQPPREGRAPGASLTVTPGVDKPREDLPAPHAQLQDDR